MIKKLIILFLLLICIISPLYSRVFIDDLGRRLTIDEKITKIAPSGSFAQVILLTYDPSLLVATADKISSKDASYYSFDVHKLPALGTFYGKKANLNKEALIMSSPQVVIDIGEIKGSKEEMIKDLDTLQKQIGIPVVFLESYLINTEKTYLRLSELLGNVQRAKELGSFSSEAISFANNLKAKITKPVTFYYSTSNDGLNAIAQGNIHGEVLELVGGVNVIKASKTTGENQVSLEQIILQNPQVIILGNKEAYDLVTKPKSPWASIDAVKNNKVFLVPNIINNWLDNPPSVNRIIGIYYAASILYPQLANINLDEKAIEFYKLFYNYELK